MQPTTRTVWLTTETGQAQLTNLSSAIARANRKEKAIMYISMGKAHHAFHSTSSYRSMFDVEETDPEVNVAGAFETPVFHFQFLFDNLAGYEITKVVKKETQEEITKQNNSDLYENITAGLVFTTVATDNIYYANVTSFVEDNSGIAGANVTIKPNSIYKMSEVSIAPFNLGFGTVSEDAQNVIVKVSVLPYNEVKVLPSFK